MNKCDVCGEWKEDVEYTIDPYGEEIYDEEVWMWLCADCYAESANDI